MATVENLQAALARFDAVSDQMLEYVAKKKAEADAKPAGPSDEELQAMADDLNKHTDALAAAMADVPAPAPEAPAPEVPAEVPTDGTV